MMFKTYLKLSAFASVHLTQTSRVKAVLQVLCPKTNKSKTLAYLTYSFIHPLGVLELLDSTNWRKGKLCKGLWPDITKGI